MKKLFSIIILSLFLFGCATSDYLNRGTRTVGLVQSELVTATIDCKKCVDGLTNYCIGDPCTKKDILTQELDVLLERK